MCLSSADLDRTERCMNTMEYDAISTNMATEVWRIDADVT
jgi:hypothetical protein